jgi:glycine/D-amino acid oxidase-like deaminating enzyme
MMAELAASGRRQLDTECLESEVLIVGGSLAGLRAAIAAAEAGARVVVLCRGVAGSSGSACSSACMTPMMAGPPQEVAPSVRNTDAISVQPFTTPLRGRAAITLSRFRLNQGAGTTVKTYTGKKIPTAANLSERDRTPEAEGAELEEVQDEGPEAGALSFAKTSSDSLGTVRDPRARAASRLEVPRPVSSDRRPCTVPGDSRWMSESGQAALDG